MYLYLLLLRFQPFVHLVRYYYYYYYYYYFIINYDLRHCKAQYY